MKLLQRIPFAASTCLALLILSCPNSALAKAPADGGESPSSVVAASFDKPKTLRFGIAVEGLSEGSQKLVGDALSLVRAGAPKGLSLEGKQSDPYDFIIAVTTSDEVAAEIAKVRTEGGVLSSTAEAYTIVLKDYPDGPYIVRLIWDKVGMEIRNGALVERSDAFVRIVAALGHEIYGNVRSFSRSKSIFTDPKHIYSPKIRELDQVQFELAAFRAGTQTLNRLIKLGQTLPNFPKKVLEDLKNALFREEEGLRSWERRAIDLGISGAAVIDINCMKTHLQEYLE